ncbi:hypothetical protein C8A00DRAFT_47429 [Chaetomidium leptoderma]|uniref:Uncharacterized protein n=1 Tax=Chaetomidium leptoderma TaxID=669021 RepID=A0AAN6ZTX2_9PEZI|nr:hypothetical protein C8A00DRAFT_47429 [Chaetomidium leptoderma]
MLKKLLASLLSLAAVAQSSFSEASNIKRHSTELDDEYDFIIVGGGTSNTRVLVVEFGDFDDTWDTALPYNANNLQRRLMFNMTAVPTAGLGNRTFPLWIGATVGGGSTVNGMAFERGSKADYDAWEELGNPSWGWNGLLPYFKKSTTFTPPPLEYVARYNYTWDSAAYGKGPIQVGFPSWQWPNVDTPPNRCMGKGSKSRSSARTGYFNPARGRANLDLLTRHYVSKIEFKGNAAVGVQVVSRATGKVALARAKKEVIMAAGAVNTARTLQLSGVGPAPLLRSLGIKTVVDAPGVGANFQDHPWFSVILQYTSASPVNPNILTPNRTGSLTLSHGKNIVFLSLSDLTTDYRTVAASLVKQDATAYLPPTYRSNPALLSGLLAQRSILRNRYLRRDADVVEMPFGGSASVVSAIQKPLSRGTIFINSTDPDPVLSPVIDFSAMTTPRRYIASRSLATLGLVELSPGSDVETDQQIEAVLRNSLILPSFAHPSGTAAMMPRSLGGVVDPRLKVYGTTGLRVVDASIMPLIPACHLQSTVYAIAEKAADLIQGRC